MKKQYTILNLILATFLLTGCYTELAVLNTAENGYASRTRDFTNTGQATQRSYTTNPSAYTDYNGDFEENGVFVDYNNVPASDYLGVNPDITNRELAELILDTRNDVRNLGCDPLFFDQINCRNDFLFQPGFSFNRFSMFNQFNRFGIGGLGFGAGFGNMFFDPFWDYAFFGSGFGFFNDPFLSPFAYSRWNAGFFGLGVLGWGAPFGLGWNNHLAWNNNGVFVPLQPDQGVNTINNGRSSRGSNVGRSYVRDRADSRNIPKADNSSVRSARTSASSTITGVRSSYTSTTGARRAARTPSNSRLTVTNSTNNTSRSSYVNSIGRRAYSPSRGVSNARSNSTYSYNTPRSTYNKYNSGSTYNTGSRSSYSTPRSSVGSSSRSSSGSSRSSSVGRSAGSSSSRGSSTSRGKRGNN